jgi:hypothetical protein
MRSAQPWSSIAGLDRPCAGYGARDAQLAALSMAGQEGVDAFPLEAAAWLPPTVLMSTCTDMVVPWWVRRRRCCCHPHGLPASAAPAGPLLVQGLEGPVCVSACT